jgi:hypothetical protein
MRRIGHRLAATQLRAARLHDQRAAAKLAHRHVERYPGPGRVLLEDHGEHVPGQWGVGIRAALGPALPRGLAVERIADHRSDGIAAGIGEADEMTSAHAGSA